MAGEPWRPGRVNRHWDALMNEENRPDDNGRFADDATLGLVDERDGNSPFPIVGIGASAGGLEAITQLLSSLPTETGMAFVVVQHLDPRHESRLPELLGRATRMPVL